MTAAAEVREGGLLCAMNEPRWRREHVDGCLVASPNGVLDALNYRAFRDTMIKFAVEAPRAVIVAIDRLSVPSPSSLTVFTSAALHVSGWPGVPIVIVTGRADQQAALENSRVSRFVSVFPDVAAAVAAAAAPPRCSRTTLELGHDLLSARRARLFVRSTCADWQIPELIGDAEQIATELVENAVQHSESRPVLRLELRRGLFTVAVSDDSPHEAVLVERLSGMDRGIGLRIVAQRAKAWGCSPRLGGGKVVWAVLRVPGSPAYDSRA